MDSIFRMFLKQNKSHRQWRHVIQICAAVVVFCTTYALILPAITWDKTLICEKQEHTHSSICYETVDGEERLICSLEEHIHDDSCFDAPPSDEPLYDCIIPAHTHSVEAGCYNLDGSLKCTMSEHIHSTECNSEIEATEEEASQKTYYCGITAHTHSAENGCYNPDGSLSCSLIEHVHNEDCEKESVLEEEPIYYCGMVEHTHNDACYEDGILICDYPEHTHTDRCLVPVVMKSMPRMAAPRGNGTYTIPAVVTSEARANDWQVVSGRYSDLPGAEDQLTKIIKDQDGNVLRLRKNLVPTGTENEFYVYLTVEAVYYHDWKTIFLGSGMLVNNANNTANYYESFSKDENISTITRRMGVNSLSSLLVSASLAPLDSTKTQKTKFDTYISTIRLTKPDGEYITITDCNLVYSLSQSSADSFTIIYCAPNGDYSVKLSNISWNKKGQRDPNNPGTLTFPQEAYKLLIEANSQVFDHVLQRSFPQFVTDPMGEHIEYVEDSVICSKGTASFADNTLIWDLSSEQIEPSQNPADYIQINTDDAYSRTGAYQMVYKVRLKVEDDGFSSAAAQMTAKTGVTVNPTNKETTVTYHTDKSSTQRTATFDVPAVRGLLYDVSFRKIDQYAQGVPGAIFTLTNSSGEEVGKITTGTTSDLYTFSNLPWDIYTLTESVPDDYSAEADEIVREQSWTFPLCYTTNKEVLTADTGALVGNMLYNGSDYKIPFESGGLKILNYKFTREFVLRKVTSNGSALSGAQFRLYRDEGLTDEVDAGFLTSKEDGTFTVSGFVLPAGTYYLKETVTPGGFVPPSMVGVLTVNEDKDGFTLFWQGNTLAAKESTNGYYSIYSMDIPNQPSVPLPNTGSRGKLLVTITGLLVLVITWGYYFVYRRRDR